MKVVTAKFYDVFSILSCLEREQGPTIDLKSISAWIVMSRTEDSTSSRIFIPIFCPPFYAESIGDDMAKKSENV